MRTFSGWFQNHLTGKKTVEDELYLLSSTPTLTIMTFKGYEINGNTFYTIGQDEKSTNQNSGVRFDDAINNNKKVTYLLGYGAENTNFSYLRCPNPISMLWRCKVMEGIGVHTFEDRKRETFLRTWLA